MAGTFVSSYFREACGAVSEALGRVGIVCRPDRVAEMFEFPGRKELGDSAFPCFQFSRELKMPPPKIASALADALETPAGIVRAKPIGGYLNLWFDPASVAREVLSRIRSQGVDYGCSDEGAGKTICMDYSHPNIAKPFGVGHLRSTVIGNSLKRVFEKLGYTTRGINHLGDWGTQFGRLIVAFREWGSEEELTKNPITHLYDLYVRFHHEVKSNPDLSRRGRAEFKKLEDGDPANRALWQRFRDLSLEEFERVYRRLGVSFDSDAGEAFYEPQLAPLIARLQKAGIAVTGDDGALVIPLGRDDEPPLLLRKGDGATLYATRDLAAAEYRYKTYRFDRCLYIVGSAQALHFRQLFAALQAMGHDWVDRMVHVEFGWIKLADSMMSTRRGNIVILDDVLNEAVAKTRRIITERNPGIENVDTVAEAVGVGAVVFWILSVKRQKDVKFEWDEVVSFDGRTGPYVQYTHARVCSLLAKWGRDIPADVDDFSLLQSDEERRLLLRLDDWPRRIRRAARQYEPQVIAAALLEMAQEYNRFYQAVRILDGDPAALPARIVLADCLRTVLADGLRLLGLKAPGRM